MSERTFYVVLFHIHVHEILLTFINEYYAVKALVSFHTEYLSFNTF